MSFAREAGAKIGPLGAAFMTGPKGQTAGTEIGLDFFGYYGLGRGGVLGDVDGKTVADAFYFFNPDLVAGIWDANKPKHDPRSVAEHYTNACADWGRETFGDVEGLDDFAKLCERIAQTHEPTTSSALFRGWREMALPDDAAGRVAVLVALVLRELRGGAHVDAVKQVGLAPADAVATNQPHMFALFGWTHEMPDATAFKAQADEAEAITDASVEAAFSVLDTDERERFISVLTAIAAKHGL